MSYTLRVALLSTFAPLMVGCHLQANTPQPRKEKAWLEQMRTNLVVEKITNGPTVVCCPLKQGNHVCVGMSFPVGSAQEGRGEQGFAHMVEHMIFKGTQRLSEADIGAIADSHYCGPMGKGYNAFTSHDETLYYFMSDTHNWRVFVDILADCSLNSAFKEAHMVSEVKTVFKELGQRRSDPSFFAQEQLFKMLFEEGHPYHHSIGGSKDVLFNATPEDLCAFYQREYLREDALMIVVGDVDPAAVCAQARKAFKEHERHDSVRPSKRAVLKECAEMAVRTATYQMPVSRPRFFYGWALPALKESCVPAQCLSEIVQRRLERSLIDAKKLVTSVHVSPILKRKAGILAMYCESDTAEKHDAVTKEIEAEWQAIAKSGVTPQELAAAQAQSLTALLHGCESPMGFMALYSEHFFEYQNAQAFFDLPQRIEMITSKQLQTFAKRHLAPACSAQITVVPLEGVKLLEWESKTNDVDLHEHELLESKLREHPLDEVSHAAQLPQAVLIEPQAIRPDAEFVLPNGLQVYVKQRTESPFVSMNIHFKDYEKLLCAHYKAGESMLAQAALALHLFGSAEHTKQDLHAFFDARGADVHFDQSGAGCSCLEGDFAACASMVRKVLAAPAYVHEPLQQWKDMMQARLAKARIHPHSVATKLLQQQVYSPSAWFAPTYDEQEERIQEITIDKLAAFHKAYVTPQNMFVVFAGNIDLATIQADCAEIFGSWSATHQQLLPCEVPRHAEEPAYSVHPSKAAQATLLFGRSIATDSAQEDAARALIEPYVYKKLFDLRQKNGLFYTFKIQLTSMTSAYEGLASMLFPTNFFNVPEVEKQVSSVLEQIAQEGIPQHEIDSAVHAYQMVLAKQCSDNESYLSTLVNLKARNKPWDWQMKRLEVMRTLTKATVDKVAATFLDPQGWHEIKAGRVSKDDRSQFGRLKQEEAEEHKDQQDVTS